MKRTKKTSWHRKEPVLLVEKIGSRITDIRHEKGIGFNALVEAIEPLGKGYLSQLSRGMVVPGVVALDKIAKALCVDLIDLVNVEPGMRQELVDATAKLSRKQVAGLLKVARKMLEGGK